MSDQQPTDGEILADAQKIVTERGIGLLEAMEIAAHRLANRGKEIDCEFNVKLVLKPRVAKFIRESFAGHPELSVEERLARFLEIQINQIRGRALAATREDLEISEGQAATVRRSTFLEKYAG